MISHQLGSARTGGSGSGSGRKYVVEAAVRGGERAKNQKSAAEREEDGETCRTRDSGSSSSSTPCIVHPESARPAEGDTSLAGVTPAGPPPPRCPVCTRTLPNAVALKNHLRIHTLSPSSAHTEEESEEVPEETGHDERDYGLAQDLSDGFGRSHLSNSGMGHSVLQSHETDDHGKKGSPESDDAWDRPFKCDQCDRTYRHHGSLVNHKKCHQQGTFKCSVCFKQFSNLAALNSHERTHSKFKTPGASMVSSSSSGTQSSQSDDTASCFCHLCQVALPNKADFQEHILLHNKPHPRLDCRAASRASCLTI
ncbi:hypothetical protein D5F01_LYC18058 [Larimichthys crocea]|uniref:C2H2-type domain-containing protein n=1 Tax=Larimichthys crocea TaxID=215358 RepID=A0A6G0HU13_LARCR|nr:hypothetical protein D5F01_LYC18058 [Larimichthys crocea]